MDLEKIAREHVSKLESVATIGVASLGQLLIKKGIITEEEFQNTYNEIEELSYKATLKQLKIDKTTKILDFFNL